MRCGVVVDATGNVRHGWALISDEGAQIPINDGDEVIEFQIPHGEEIEPESEREQNARVATAYVDTIIPVMRRHTDIDPIVRALRSTPPQRQRITISELMSEGQQAVYHVGERRIRIRETPGRTARGPRA